MLIVDAKSKHHDFFVKYKDYARFGTVLVNYNMFALFINKLASVLVAWS